jgi:hypothetical protein
MAPVPTPGTIVAAGHRTAAAGPGAVAPREAGGGAAHTRREYAERVAGVPAAHGLPGTDPAALAGHPAVRAAIAAGVGTAARVEALYPS